MNSAGLTPEQAAKIVAAVNRRLHYLERLTGRMCQKWFPWDDPLKVAGEDALKAMRRLKTVVDKLAARVPNQE